MSNVFLELQKTVRTKTEAVIKARVIDVQLTSEVFVCVALVLIICVVLFSLFFISLCFFVCVVLSVLLAS